MSPPKRKAGDILTFEPPKPKKKVVETIEKVQKVKVLSHLPMLCCVKQKLFKD
jgi:hypothetical protein